jgi:energy-coupling factor transport system permease protein
MNGRAQAAWSAVALVIALGGTNPLVRALIAVVSLDLLLTQTPPGRSLRPVLFGVAIAAVLATALNLLLAHVGRDVIVSLPAGIPILGGPITIESAAFGIATGLGLAAAILAVAPLSLVLAPHDLLDAFPAGLERSAILVATALNLVPAIRRSSTGVIEAQRLRGQRSRGPALWREVLVPVILTAFENSLQLAEAMEARAFGSGRRSRWEPAAFDWVGRLTLAAAVVALALVIAARLGGADLDWQPYPSLTVPAVSPLILAACLVLVVPWLPWPRRASWDRTDGER